MRNRCCHNAARGGFAVRLSVRWAGAALLVLTLLLAGTTHATETPLVFGVFPNLTARQTVKTYGPLAQALERHLKRPVILYTAPDFPTFVARTRGGAYDLVLTAPHMAWLARQETGYRPLLKYSNPVRGVLVTRSDAGFATVEALRGRTVAIADELALATLAVEMDLAARGIERGHDYTVQLSGTHSNAIAQVIARRADAAIIGIHPYRLLPDTLRAQLHILVETVSLSSLTYLAHPRVRDGEAKSLQAGLLVFAGSPEGRAFLAESGYGEMVGAEDSELNLFRQHALRAQALLRARR